LFEGGKPVINPLRCGTMGDEERIGDEAILQAVFATHSLEHRFDKWKQTP